VKVSIPWVLMVLAGVLLWQIDGCHREKQGELNQRIKSREVVIAALAKQKAKVDTQYLKAKPIFVAAVAGWDSLKLTLGEKVKINPVVLAGDQVVGACTTLIALCEERNQMATTIMLEQDSTIRDLKKRKPSWLSCVVGGGANILGSRALAAGVFCGPRIK
jgi:hypothetical protein